MFCFKPPYYIDLFLTKCSKSFQDTQVVETGLSNFEKMNITVLKMFYTKQNHNTLFYRNYKTFDSTHLFSNKVESKKKITLVENNKITSNDVEIAKTLKSYFDKVVGNLDINRNLECVRESFKEDPVLTSIQKYAAYSSIKNIRSRMNGINSNFF